MWCLCYITLFVSFLVSYCAYIRGDYLSLGRKCKLINLIIFWLIRAFKASRRFDSVAWNTVPVQTLNPSTSAIEQIPAELSKRWCWKSAEMSQCTSFSNGEGTDSDGTYREFRWQRAKIAACSLRTWPEHTGQTLENVENLKGYCCLHYSMWNSWNVW